MTSRSFNTTVALAVFVAALSTSAWASSVPQETKLLPADGAADVEFGVSVAVNRDTAVIGAHSDADNGLDSGAAYVFTRSGGVWTEQQKLLAADGAGEDHFGRSVAVDGDTALIGAWKDDDNGLDSGSVYVFTRSNGVWTEQQKLLASDGSFDDSFGFSIAVDGDTAIIGALEGDDVNGLASGAAYVFTRSNGVWTEQQKLVASDGGTFFDGFGTSVALDGETAVIGKPGDDDNGWNSGSAYVFTRSNGVWTEEAELLPSDGAASKAIADSVAVDGDTALIGASADDDNGFLFGAVYVFTRSNGVWTEQQKLFASDGGVFHLFGRSIAVDADMAVVGTLFGSRAYVFTRSNGVWAEQQKLVASDGPGGWFGDSVAMDGEMTLIGAPRDDDNGLDSGSAYVFSFAQSATELLSSLIDTVGGLNIQHGIENSLDAKADAAIRALADVNANNDVAAINSLGAFINAVDAQSGNQIPEADADMLIAAAQEIIDLLLDGLAAPAPVQFESGAL